MLSCTYQTPSNTLLPILKKELFSVIDILTFGDPILTDGIHQHNSYYLGLSYHISQGPFSVIIAYRLLLVIGQTQGITKLTAGDTPWKEQVKVDRRITYKPKSSRQILIQNLELPIQFFARNVCSRTFVSNQKPLSVCSLLHRKSPVV